MATSSHPMDPIFVSVKTAAAMLSMTPWQVYKLCDQGVIVSQYDADGRRLVRVESVRAYADSLPTEKEADR